MHKNAMVYLWYTQTKIFEDLQLFFTYSKRISNMIDYYILK